MELIRLDGHLFTALLSTVALVAYSFWCAGVAGSMKLIIMEILLVNTHNHNSLNSTDIMRSYRTLCVTDVLSNDPV